MSKWSHWGNIYSQASFTCLLRVMSPRMNLNSLEKSPGNLASIILPVAPWLDPPTTQINKQPEKRSNNVRSCRYYPAVAQRKPRVSRAGHLYYFCLRIGRRHRHHCSRFSHHDCYRRTCWFWHYSTVEH